MKASDSQAPTVTAFVHDGPDKRTPTAASSRGLPPFQAEQAVVRLRWLSAIFGLLFVGAWAFKTAAEGNIGTELGQPHQIVPIATIAVACAAMYATAQARLFSSRTISNIGLGFQVIIAYAFTAAQVLGAFSSVDAGSMTHDTVGVMDVALWMFAYNALVPTPPRRALIALVLGAAAPAVLYGASVWEGSAPSLGGGQFFFILIFPYILVVVLAWFVQRVIYRLGHDVRRAREMGAYRLEELLGKGGMGEVYSARHRMLARPAAVKLIRRDALGDDPAVVETVIRRFEREAQVTSRLQSPHTVELYDFGVNEEGVLYYVMELLEGVDLDTLVKEHGPVPPERAIHILVQVCASLQEAHERGLVHRDIKPANISVCHFALEHDFVKVLDFGLVKRQTEVDDAEEAGLTGGGAMLGTPLFMAPEVIKGDEVGPAADLYALGCVAYWLLTGEHVFDASSSTRAIIAHVSEQALAPSIRSTHPVPPALDELVLACLQKDPSGRPRSAQAVAEALRAVETEARWDTARAASWWQEHPRTAT